MSAPFINCTPHDISVVQNGETKTFAKSNVELRLTSAPQIKLPFDHTGVSVVTKQTFVGVEWPVNHGIKDSAWILVSMPVGDYFAAHPKECKHWVFGPDTGPEAAIRNEKGQIVGTTRLIFYAAPFGTRSSCPCCATWFEKTEYSYCPTCGYLNSDQCHFIEGTRLLIRDSQLVRIVDTVDEHVKHLPPGTLYK